MNLTYILKVSAERRTKEDRRVGSSQSFQSRAPTSCQRTPMSLMKNAPTEPPSCTHTYIRGTSLRHLVDNFWFSPLNLNNSWTGHLLYRKFELSSHSYVNDITTSEMSKIPPLRWTTTNRDSMQWRCLWSYTKHHWHVFELLTLRQIGSALHRIRVTLEQTFEWLIDRSINQLISSSIYQSTNQPNDQAINQAVSQSKRNQTIFNLVDIFSLNFLKIRFVKLLFHEWPLN